MLFTLLTDSSLQCHIVVKIVALFLTLVEIFLVFPIKILTLQLKYVCVCMCAILAITILQTYCITSTTSLTAKKKSGRKPEGYLCHKTIE